MEIGLLECLQDIGVNRHGCILAWCASDQLKRDINTYGTESVRERTIDTNRDKKGMRVKESEMMNETK